jgi:hypothetical protein
VQAPGHAWPHAPQLDVLVIGFTQAVPHVVKLQEHAPDTQVKPPVQAVWFCHCPPLVQSCGVFPEQSVVIGTHIPMVAVKLAAALEPVVGSATVRVPEYVPLAAYVCPPVTVNDPEPPLTVPAEVEVPSPHAMIAVRADAGSPVFASLTVPIDPLNATVCVPEIDPPATVSCVMHCPALQTLFAPQDVPPLPAMNESVQADCPLAQVVVPVWQTLVGVQVTPAVHASHAPAKQTLFVPHEAPSVAATIESAQVAMPPVHALTCPVWQRALGGVQGAPTMHALQMPPLQ